MNDERPIVPGVIAPPPVIFVTPLLLGIGIDTLWPAGIIAGEIWRIVGGVLALAGATIMVAGWNRFRVAGTAVQPWRRSTVLVTDGLYRFTRNPMYLGMTVLYLGMACALGDVVTLALLVPVLAVMRWGVIEREERYLEQIFGDDYRAYQARVRRWL